MKYNPSLDGLRTIAVIAVLLLHTAHRLPTPENDADHLIYSALRIGWVGVDLFFVLSGFLITRILLANKQSSLRKYCYTFYMRRSLRIFPLYYLVVPITLVALWVWQTPGPTTIDWCTQLTYTQNIIGLFFRGNVDKYLGHTWSLAVEEHFYLVWPFFVFFAPRGTLLRLAIAGVLLALFLRIGLLIINPDTTRIYNFTLTRVDSMMFGAILAILPEGKYQRSIRFAGLVAGIAFLSAGVINADAYASTTFNRSVGFTCMGVASTAIVSTCLDANWFSRALRVPLLSATGKLTYGIYLYHLPVFTLLASFLNPLTEGMPYTLRVISLFLFASSTTVVIAKISFICFEQHFLKLKSLVEYDEHTTKRPVEAAEHISNAEYPHPPLQATEGAGL